MHGEGIYINCPPRQTFIRTLAYMVPSGTKMGSDPMIGQIPDILAPTRTFKNLLCADREATYSRAFGGGSVVGNHARLAGGERLGLIGLRHTPRPRTPKLEHQSTLLNICSNHSELLSAGSEIRRFITGGGRNTANVSDEGY